MSSARSPFYPPRSLTNQNPFHLFLVLNYLNVTLFGSQWWQPQCCGAETICFGSSSGSDFKKIYAPAPAPAPAPTEAFWVPVFTAFK
jgi:hypothetical protein